MALMAVPFNPTMTGVAGAALGYINGAKQCLQGNYYEGGTEIVLTTAAIAAPFVLEKISNAKAVRALKNADEILDVSDNIDDAERLTKSFKNKALLEDHFSKHGEEIASILDDPYYSVNKYLDDANYIINNGVYSPELNGYVCFMKGKKFGFVGVDRIDGNITTFHIKSLSELIKKAPSLGLGK